MDNPQNQNGSNNITWLLVAVVVLAIIIIATLTVTAIVAGPPAV